MPPFTFNPDDLQRLNRLVFAARGRTSDATGARRSRKAGDGIDFLDFRSYASGDNVRQIDWNVYGRTRQLFVRLRESPRQLSVTLLLDASKSMQFGAPITKFEQAQRLACALGFIAMRGGDRVYAHSFAEYPSPGIGPLTGARGLPSLVNFLQDIQLGGTSDLTAAIQSLRASRKDRGLIIILSDFLNVQHPQTILPASGGTILSIQILDPLDRGQGLSGNLQLRDSETGHRVEVKIDDKTLHRYQAAFDKSRQELESRSTGPQRHYLCAWTGDSYLDLVCQVLRAKAVVR